MTDHVPPPFIPDESDDSADDTPDVPKTTPPAGGYDTEQLTLELMREEGSSYEQAERFLAKLRSEHSLGQVRTLIDQWILDGR
ncbi:hypothetical protein [Halorhabdus salina]|uniref:hypothetical protein n=1 Tax=Halorhabdus salina TaxID=2750670 RepID=UPI0015EFA956|nr:hypothetical protein [Halorhabdus salina]